MFIIIEMDGFGYPMIDLLFNVVITKGKEMYENTKKIMSLENVEKEFSEQIYNKKGLSRFELKKSYEKKEMNLEDNYSDVLTIYWITMFYLSIYTVGIIQSFFNLLFKFIIEKIFLMFIKDLIILILNLDFYVLIALILDFSYFYVEILFSLEMKIIKNISELDIL